MANPFVHLELNTPDAPKAKEFYNELFGWQFQDMDTGATGIYSVFKPDSGPGGGLMSVPGNYGWLCYVGVHDIHACTGRARELGANILHDSQEIINVGWMTIMNDPTGCSIAMFQPKADTVEG
ncbi:MAG TPA: VOC family protein [Acidobacteriaceae bacterium]|jgi:hypothetical protein